MKKIIIYLSGIFFGIQLYAQDIQLSGTVRDNQGEPLIGVAVFIEGSSNGAMTDIDGKYSISVPSKAVVTFDYMGFRQVRESVSGRKIIDVVMEEDRTLIYEAVVVGY